jgi:radical SAM protein with 4Fe4S-binding SPASM domain
MYPLLAYPHKIKLQPDFSTLYIAKNNRIHPEYINESAAAIFSLCNGENSVQDIILKLAEKYHESMTTVQEFVDSFLKESEEMGVISRTGSPCPVKLDILGSFEYWTPDQVIIELTHNCPLSCKHCYLNAGNGPEMDRKLLERLSAEIVTLGLERVHLTGGEPFIYPGIAEIISFFSKNKIYLTISTSGMVASPEIFQALETIKENSGWVQVSLDGLQDTHNNFRGHHDSFSRAVSFIRKLTAMNIPVQTATCVTEQSLDEIEDLCREVKNWGIKRFRVGTVSNRGRARSNNLPVSLEFKEKLNRMRKVLKMKYEDANFTIANLEDNFPPESEESLNENCGAGYRSLKISPEGTIHPCPMIDYVLGDLRNGTFSELIKGNTKNFPGAIPPSEQICVKCPNLIHCRGCLAEGLLYSGTVDKCAWKEHQAVSSVFFAG